MVIQTILGSAKYAQVTGKHPADLRNQVTSPAGTTTEGLRALEKAGLRLAFIEAIQAAYNRKNNISPETIRSRIKDILASIYEGDYYTVPAAEEKAAEYVPPHEVPALARSLRKEMARAVKALDFERAAELRDRIRELDERELKLGGRGKEPDVTV